MGESPKRGGFSLLEMLLTLAMSVVLLTLISQSIRYYARDLTNVEDDYRASLIATTTLRRIEDDLRSAAIGRPVSMEPMIARLAAATGVEAVTAAAGVEMTDDLPPGDLPPNDPTTEATEPIAGEIGLAGGPDWLRVDVRSPVYLPPPAEDLTGAAINRPPTSDLQTVSYWVEAGGIDPLDALKQISGGEIISDGAAGLLRQSVDRAVGLQAATMGSASTGTLISPEVTAIGLEYYDGMLWQTQYDSIETGTLPMAIRVTLAVGIDRMFTHTIGLPAAPAAEPVVDDAELPPAGDLP